MNRYFKTNEAEQYTFYRIPKALFKDIRYKSISADAKLLYGILLDRMGLSITNHWTDKNDNVYIYYTVESIENLLGFKQDKIRKLFRELESADLLERKQQGLGKPNKLYVKTFISDYDKSVVRTTEKTLSVPREIPKCDYRKSVPNDTEINNTELIKNNLSISKADFDEMTDRIKQNIEYDILIQRYSPEAIDEVVGILVDAICGNCEKVQIGFAAFPHEVVKSRLLKLTAEHIEYVLDRLKQNTTKIYNIKNYLLASLYNATLTMDAFYQAEVNHDLYGTKEEF